MEIKQIPGGVCAAEGFLAAGVHAGIRRNKKKKDMALIYSEVPCSVAAVFTRNKVFGAPIIVTKRNIADGYARAIVCNSGNANTCNADGLEKAEMMCELAAKALSLREEDMIVASTGVIGLPLNIEPIASGLPMLVKEMRRDGGLDAAQGIMTTDTHPKERAIEFKLDGKTCHIGAICKGSGMIHPNMATMLCFVTSDVNIEPAVLQTALRTAVRDSFNMISVDGDTSTNDMVIVLANGEAQNTRITSEEDKDFAALAEALRTLLIEMSKLIAGDGEGCTKLIECHVTGVPHDQLARDIAKSIITSSLTKAAMFGSDANWGRVLCAIGYTEGDFRVDTIDVWFSSAKGRILVCEKGMGVDFSEEKAKEILLEPEICIEVAMNQGEAEATAWGCDLTYDYVRINGDYRT